MEIGFGQSERVSELFAADERWIGLTFEKDLSGIERTAVAFRR
jgi:methylase of polypeptide subunit release factors